MKNEIKTFRRKIDKIDNKLITLLEKRFEIVKDIKKYKSIHKIPLEDKNREQKIINSKLKNSSLSKDFIKKLFELIFKESKKLQRTK